MKRIHLLVSGAGRRPLGLVAVPTVALLLGTMGPSPARAAPDGPAPIVGEQSGKCLDADPLSLDATRPMRIYACGQGEGASAGGQDWTYTASGRLSTYPNDFDAYCLNVEGVVEAGAFVEIFPCSAGAGSIESWDLNANGTITERGSGLCLDVSGQRVEDGSRVTVWPCNGGANQRWRAPDLRPQTASIGGVPSGRCLEADPLSQDATRSVVIFDCGRGSGHAAGGQDWTATSDGKLSVFRSRFRSFCLNAEEATRPGTLVDVFPCDSTAPPVESWNINADGTITERGSGLCLDVLDRNTANGSRVSLWTCNGGANQKWATDLSE